MTTEKLPEENKNVGGVSPSDHDSLIELYARFGVELKSEQFGGHYLVFFPVAPLLNLTNTESLYPKHL